MIHISKQAAREIRKRFVAHRDAPVWIRVAPYGERCAAYLTLKPEDGKRETDEVLSEDGFSVVADRLLLHSLGGIQISFDASHWGGGNLTVRPLVNLETGTCGDCRC